MKGMIITALLIGLGVAAFRGYKAYDTGEFRKGQLARCQDVMDKAKAGGIANEQDAWGMWYWGRLVPPPSNTIDGWQKFASEGRLHAGMSATCTDSKVVDADDSAGRSAIVSCDVDGRAVKVRAKHNAPLEWFKE